MRQDDRYSVELKATKLTHLVSQCFLFPINDVREFALRLNCSRDKNSGFLTRAGLGERARLKGNGPYRDDDII